MPSWGSRASGTVSSCKALFCSLRRGGGCEGGGFSVTRGSHSKPLANSLLYFFLCFTFTGAGRVLPDAKVMARTQSSLRGKGSGYCGRRDAPATCLSSGSLVSSGPLKNCGSSCSCTASMFHFGTKNHATHRKKNSCVRTRTSNLRLTICYKKPTHTQGWSHKPCRSGLRAGKALHASGSCPPIDSCRQRRGRCPA